MGKDLKGRNCGEGIGQRKDGMFYARFTDRQGRRQTKYFKNIPEARNWLADAKYADRYEQTYLPPTLTVNDWFHCWIETIVGGLAPNTIRNYRERYVKNVQPVIGDMQLSAVKPIHCKKIFNNMERTYAASTIRQTYITLGAMLKSAKENDLISKHPMDGVRFHKPVRAADDITFLTVEEQKTFLEAAKRTHNYPQYAFLLETGLRTGEMIGLTWSDIDWKNRTLTVCKTLEYRHSNHEWYAGPPKSTHAYRTIPLTDYAYELLKAEWNFRDLRKKSPELDHILYYTDRRTGGVKHLVMRDLVFVNWRTGMPNKNSSYDTHLYKVCAQAGIQKISMHTLRHTYATRAIESGMQPKVLQKLLGHSSIKMTMDRYVHVTDESMAEAVKNFKGVHPA